MTPFLESDATPIDRPAARRARLHRTLAVAGSLPGVTPIRPVDRLALRAAAPMHSVKPQKAADPSHSLGLFDLYVRDRLLSVAPPEPGPMIIPDAQSRHFATLLRATADDALALLECRDAATEARRFVLCAIGFQGDRYAMTPFGHLCDGNPYEVYVPPDTDMID